MSRFLLFLFVGVAVGIAALWIAGGKRDEYTAKIEIQRSRSQVFPFFVKPDLVKQWMSEIDYIDEPIPPKEGSYEVAPKLTRIHKSADGTRTEYADKVIRYKQDETLTVQSFYAGTTFTSILQLDEAGNKATSVRYDVIVSHGSMARLLAPLRKSDIESRIKQELQNLKALVEKSTTMTNQEEKTEPDQAKEAGKPTSASGVDVSGGR